MHSRSSLWAQLGLAFFVVVTLVAAVGYYEYSSVSGAYAKVIKLVGQDMVRRDLLSELKITVLGAQQTALNYDRAAEDGNTTITRADVTAQLTAAQASYHTNYAQYTSLLRDGASVPAVMRDALGVQADTMFATLHNLVSDTKNQSRLESDRTQLSDANNKLGGTIDSLSDLESQRIAQDGTDIDQSVIRLQRTVLFLIAGVVLVTSIIATATSAVLSHRLWRLREGALRIANGDFSRRVPVTNDEIGQLARAFNDMSDRLRDSYQRLGAETERDKILLESLGEGLIAVDEKTNINLINSKAIEMLELPSRDKVMGLPVNHAFSINDEQDQPLTGSATPVVQALHTSQSATGIFTLHKKDGRKVLINMAANPVVFEGKSEGAIMTLRDVTKEREVDRMKTEFISLASHQLRTPLSAIKWFTEMLVSGDAGPLNSDQSEFARNIASSTERMIALVNALLNISRIESGRIMVDPKPTDLKELVSGIVNDLKAKIEERKQNLIISVHDDLPKINLDARLIGQVYLNLLTNAIKYTPKGGEISVFISRKDNDIISQIADNGYGIPQEQQGRIFQKFFRATNAVKVETDGTGLGLYLIKAVIESSGGKIWFKSRENEGTTFWFSIPVSGMKPKQGEVTLDI